MFIPRMLLRILFGKEGFNMIKMLWAIQIMKGKKTFADVPEKLKEGVKEILIDAGCEELVTE